MLELEVDLVQRALEVRERAGLVHPGVHEHDPVARRRSPTRCSAARRARGAGGAAATRRGCTRSPRPTSRLRIDLGHRRGTIAWLLEMARAATKSAADDRGGRARVLRGPRAPGPRHRHLAVGARRRRRGSSAWPTSSHRTACATTSAGCTPPSPTSSCGSSRSPRRTSAPRCAGRSPARSPGPGQFQGLEPTGARIAIEGVRPGRGARRPRPRDRRLHRRRRPRAPARGAAAAGLADRAADDQGPEPPHPRWPAACARRRSRSPRACGSCGAACRARASTSTSSRQDGDGVLMFDAGIRMMANGLAAAGAQLGGITRIVLGHGHVDHRGAAPGLRGVPVYCHPDNVADARGRRRPALRGLSKRSAPARWIYPRCCARGTAARCEIEETIAEGDDIAGFEAVLLPGHAPGQIAPVARLRPPGAHVRLLLHGQPRALHRGQPIVPHRRPSTSTTSRRSRACASSPRSSPRRPGPATRTRSPATSARSSRPPPTAASSAPRTAARGTSSVERRKSGPGRLPASVPPYFEATPARTRPRCVRS